MAALVYHVGLHRAAFLIQVVTFLARSSQRFWMESRIYFDNGYVVRNETCIEPAFLNYRNLSGELPQSNTGNMLADCRSNASQTPDRILCYLIPLGGGGGHSLHNGLYREVPPEMDTVFSLLGYKRVGFRKLGYVKRREICHVFIVKGHRY